MRTTNFKVDTKLAVLLGENYRSSEQAIKELVDNAWDADAENVWITLPEIITDDHIIIKDDGMGMTDREVENEYLVIASDRVSRKGERSILKNRLVKGKRGIGKFAGLVTASEMKIETFARGNKTTITITKKDLLKSKRDLEKVNIPIFIDPQLNLEKGTTITLTSLNQNLNFPSVDKLKQLLILDYGHEKDFNIHVNKILIGIDDIPGKVYEGEFNHPEYGKIVYKYSIADKPLKQHGLALKVNGKTIGKPLNFESEENEEIPSKLYRRMYGEVHADCLKDDITADWGAIIENSKAFEAVKEVVEPELESSMKDVFKTEIKLSKARLQKEINKELEKLPENRRKFAEAALEKILKRFWGDSDEKIKTIISIVIETFEKDAYWTVIKNIDDAKKSDIEIFAEALNDFGLVDIAYIARQAQNRLKYLDELQNLIDNPKTKEMIVHKAIENNLWILGSRYSLMSSNKSLKKVVEDILNEKYKGDKYKNRPDLLLSQSINRNYLLIEFKRPSAILKRLHEQQALEYRDELNVVLHNKKIEIIIIGGKVYDKISSLNERDDVQFITYNELISTSRVELDWLMKELINSKSTETKIEVVEIEN